MLGIFNKKPPQSLEEQEQQSNQTGSTQEIVELSIEDKIILAKITHPNRKPIAEDILLGPPLEELYDKYDYYSVEEMRRQINTLKGKPRICKTCNVR